MATETEVKNSSQESTIELSKQLRKAIAAGHDHAEATGLAKAIAAATVTEDDYVKLLQQMYHVHACLESHLKDQEHLQDYAHSSQFRLAHIEQDLASFGAKPNVEALASSAQLIEKIEVWAGSLAILGALYILEGSRMGSRVLAPKLAQALDRRNEIGAGLDYHLAGQKSFIPHFMAFKAKVDQIVSPEDRQQIITAAQETMSAMAKIYSELSKIDSSR